jgi:hypothetical protein
MRSAAPAMHKGPETEMTQTYSVSETLFEDARKLTFLIRVFHRDRRGRAGGVSVYLRWAVRKRRTGLMKRCSWTTRYVMTECATSLTQYEPPRLPFHLQNHTAWPATKSQPPLPPFAASWHAQQPPRWSFVLILVLHASLLSIVLVMMHELCHSGPAVPILAAQRGEVQQVVGRQHGFQAAAVDAVGVVDLAFFLAGLGGLACVGGVSYLVVQEGVEN